MGVSRERTCVGGKWMGVVREWMSVGRERMGGAQRLYA